MSESGDFKPFSFLDSFFECKHSADVGKVFTPESSDIKIYVGFLYKMLHGLMLSEFLKKFTAFVAVGENAS